MHAPLHVGILTPALAGVTAPGSGIGVHFRHLADALTQAGHRVTCVLPLENDPGPLPALPFAVVPVVARPPRLLPLLGRLSWQLHQWCMLRALLAAAAEGASSRAGVQIWETTSTGSPALRFLNRRQRAPVVTRVSTTALQLRVTNGGVPTWISRRVEAWERLAVRRSDALVTHTDGHRAALAREFDVDPAGIALVPHGLPLPADTPPPRAEGAGVRILYVGRLETRKGIDLLLAALPSVLAKNSAVTVDLAGLDSDDRWARTWREKNPGLDPARVRFLGRVSDAELAACYARADLLAAPSRYESFGLMFVEAMGHALPIIALRAPGALDLLEHGVSALLTPPDDIAALAAALDRLCADAALRRDLGLAGRRTALARYSLDALAKGSETAYREVIAARSTKRGLLARS